MAETVREWLVGGALVESDGRLLLVRNQRRGGYEDWSTPGGVIDADDGSLLDGLTREVEEETGLRVTCWEGPLYEVGDALVAAIDGCRNGILWRYYHETSAR